MKWVLAALTLIHGLIHLMGFVDGLGIKRMAELTNNTLVALSPAAKIALSYVWLVAFLAFVITVIGLITDSSWWRLAAITGVVVSQILIIIWWQDARMGTLSNLIILGAVLFYHP